MGTWQRLPDDDAYVLERRACGASRHVCDAWREATDGLFLGLCGEARTTRHRSGGCGDAVCLDVVYTRADSPLRHGVFPEEMLRPLEAVARFLNRLAGTSVRFLGVSEGVLLYELHVDGCGGGAAVTELLRRSIRSRWPRLEVRDVTPRAVLAADGTDFHQEAP
ncbi:MAG: hypothetical protein MUC96_09805 [Myxococcaceae bacterium]|nr:hypothetical protein [Myxococcaceae bacterium]